MMGVVAGLLAVGVGFLFFVKREEFIQARMTDRRRRRGGIWISGLRPLNRRDAVIAAWGAIMLCLMAGTILFAAGIRQLI